MKGITKSETSFIGMIFIDNEGNSKFVSADLKVVESLKPFINK